MGNGGKLVASKIIASTTRSYTFVFGSVIGSVVKVSLANQYLSLAEVQVFGFAMTGPKPTPVPPQPTKPATQCTFVFHPYMDSNGNDIGRYSGGVTNYKKICLANPKCTCFNTNGWVKYITKPKNQWSKWTNNKRLGLYVKTCTKPTPVSPIKPAPTTPSKPVNPPSGASKPGYSCEGANQKKNLGTGFKTPQQCLAMGVADSGCGSSIMWSKSYNYAWGCRCCVPGATYTKHNNWDIYQAEGNNNSKAIVNISKGKVATQSSTCYGGVAARAVDGNTSGVWKHNSVSHTCKGAMNTWSVTVGPSVITKIVIWNRTDCCAERIKGAKLEILNGDDLVASRNIDSTTRSYTFDFEDVVGSVVKVSRANEYLSLAEVEVFGVIKPAEPIVLPQPVTKCTFVL